LLFLKTFSGRARENSDTKPRRNLSIKNPEDNRCDIIVFPCRQGA
jgi:hypothetical protein